MSLLTWILFFLLQPSTPASTAPTKHFSPPPLNPHPKEALHVTVSFDRPQDAKRYAITMNALYQNQARECGCMVPGFNRRFVYPEGTFDIPNKSHDPRRAKFSIFLDRYDSGHCDWEFAAAQFRVHEIETGLYTYGSLGLAEHFAPGTVYKGVCPFRESTFPIGCFGGRFSVPDTPFYNKVTARRRVPVTVRVSANSAPRRPPSPSFFSNFVKPVAPNDGVTSPL